MTPTVSFEFFPPKTDAMAETLWASIERLAPLRPAFVSVTYGAGGSTRERTHATVKRILDETALHPAAHLTCVSATRAEVDEVIRSYWQAGVRHIVALRGDPPEGIGSAYQPTPGGYANAAELARGIRAVGDFEISVGCYTEKHPESASIEADLDLLKAKIDAGATRAISQFFFEPAAFLRFRDRARAAGIGVPIVPGIMPIANFKGLSRMAAGCGASIPAWLAERFAPLDDKPEIRSLVAAVAAAELCEKLVAEGVPHLHFYTLNRAELAYAVCHMLGLREAVPARSVQ
ncbi:MAG: methylenetetrahydrofolate reductase [NAD(P)H] [Alphaproteobacteria bacterium]|nr:methylenetetrahydrofolate reductase [NAD(P)H] [Alphaproteobacteria bacterium]